MVGLSELNFEKNIFRLKKWEKEVELIKQKKALYDLELDSKATFADYPLSAQERTIYPVRGSVPIRLGKGVKTDPLKDSTWYPSIFTRFRKS